MPDHTDFDPSRFTNEPFLTRVEKPWGYELIFTPPDKPYTGKLLHVDAGKRLSLQYHDEKLETIMLLRGRGILLCDDSAGELVEIEMEPAKGYSGVRDTASETIESGNGDAVRFSSLHSLDRALELRPLVLRAGLVELLEHVDECVSL